MPPVQVSCAAMRSIIESDGGASWLTIDHGLCSISRPNVTILVWMFSWQRHRMRGPMTHAVFVDLLIAEEISMTRPVAVAHWFVNNLSDHAAGEVVTHLQVQKLLYFAQAWHMLALGRPLFDEDMQAWPHGPVVPSVWHEFKKYGWQPIAPGGASEDIAQDSVNILTQVCDVYGAFAAKKLEAMTHSERPWIQARGNLSPEKRCEEVITKDSILDYYKET